MYAHMVAAQLNRAAAGLLAAVAVSSAWAPAPRVAGVAMPSGVSATAVVLDIGDGPLRARALATATSLVAAHASSTRAVAVLDVSEGLAVAGDFTTDRERALEAVRHLGPRATWTYRHATTGTDVGDPLREIVVDTARQGTPAQLVLLVELSEARVTARDYLALRDAAVAAGVSVHVIVYRQPNDREGSLLGGSITSTTQAMQECDPSRVACGDVEQVGQEARAARATALGTLQRALSRLARETGGRLTDRSDDIGALMRQRTVTRSGKEGRPAVPPPDDAETWRTRETNALAPLSRAGDVTAHIEGLHAIRVPTQAGTRLVLAVAPSSARLSPARPTFHVLRVRDAAGAVRAVFSAAQANASTSDVVVHTVDLPPGPHIVEAVVAGGDGMEVERRLTEIETAEASPAGDLFLAARVEEVGPAAVQPLSDQGRRYVPRASSVLRRSDAVDLIAVVPMRAPPTGVSLAVELVPSAGRPRRTVVDVPRRATGQTAFPVLRLPLDVLPDGTHTLRVSAEQGGRTWQRTRTFSVQP